MYKAFYNLKEAPFSLLPNPKYLYLSNKHATGIATLEYALLNSAGFSLITGEIGSGKTTLVRSLLNRVDENYVVGLVSNTHRSFGNLMQWVSAALGLEYANKEQVDLYNNFVNFVIKTYAENKRVLLIVDEAQNLDENVLEELRVLSNINVDEDQLLQVILVGQPELRETLKLPSLKQFAQRIVADFHLEPLSPEEVREYITHRLEIALADLTIFELEAMDIVANYSKGIPRIINLLCDTALVYGYATGMQNISAELMMEVVKDKQRSGLIMSQADSSNKIIECKKELAVL
ncbi:MAG: AAA family ATPase [Gammaproteobacteria bacterium]|nr:AAA family ATPase [Gammaproteobacteria bacterium]